MSPKRGSLAGLISDPGETPPPMPSPPPQRQGQEPATARAITSEVRTPEVRESVTSRPPRRSRKTQPRESRTSEVLSPDLQSSEVVTPGVPKYLRLERKDTLLWPGQLSELSVLRRTLNRARGGAGERITENTLIRLGVSLLLSRASELRGTTEEELQRSLGL